MRRHLTGPVDAPPVVLVHGLGMSSRYFRRLAGVLARSWRVLALDLPGFGASPTPSRPLTVPEHAEVLGAVLDQERLGPALLLGHSMGGQVVAHLAARAPGTASGVLLLGTTVDPAARSALGQGGRLAVDCVREPPGYLALLARTYLACGPVTYARTVGPMLAHRIEEQVPRIAVPVLVARGEHDAVAPRAWVERLAALAPRGRAAEVAGGAHGAHHSRPDAVARLCARAVDR